MKGAEKGIETQKKDSKYAMGQKIPVHVKEFSSQ
jgi:hypothetical protein